VLAVAAVGGGTFALTQTNTFGAAQGGVAGQGAGAITGYTVGAPSYTLLASDPTKISGFTFSLSTVTASTTVKAGLVAGSYANTCSVGSITGGSATVTCSYTSGSEPLVSAATNLTVVAAN
jgi:hypothetical protein